jgi:Heterokaryon incompatibility protein (HET)
MPPTTSTNNLEERRAQIDFDTLPACFKDTMEVALALGIRYVWIDSLCIIQDDEQDWDREAFLMSQVYRNATVTFLATAGESTQSQLFQRQSNRIRKVFKMPFKSKYQADIQGTVSLASSNTLSIGHSIISPVINASRWGTRGWTFQEREISRRVVFFSDAGIAFQCERTANPEESRFDRHHVLQFGGILRGFLENSKQGHELQLEPDMRRKEVDEYWKKICVEYSGTLLTYPRDRLAALSAIAKTFHEHLPGETYLAGIWSGSLIRDLLWKPGQHGSHDLANEARGPKLTIDAAPSWSWASWPGRTTSLLEKISWDLVNVPGLEIHPKIRLKGKNPYGPVLPSSHLRVRARNVFRVRSVRSAPSRGEGWYHPILTLAGANGKQLGYGGFDEDAIRVKWGRQGVQRRVIAKWKRSGTEMIALPLVGYACVKDGITFHNSLWGGGVSNDEVDSGSTDDNVSKVGSKRKVGSRYEFYKASSGIYRGGKRREGDLSTEDSFESVDGLRREIGLRSEGDSSDEADLAMGEEEKRSEDGLSSENDFGSADDLRSENAPGNKDDPSDEAGLVGPGVEKLSEDDLSSRNSFRGADGLRSENVPRDEGSSLGLIGLVRSSVEKWSVDGEQHAEWSDDGEQHAEWSDDGEQNAEWSYDGERSEDFEVGWKNEDSNSVPEDDVRLSYVGILLTSRRELGPNVFERAGTFFFPGNFLLLCEPEERFLMIV